jgi:hypothetical protein
LQDLDGVVFLSFVFPYFDGAVSDQHAVRYRRQALSQCGDFRRQRSERFRFPVGAEKFPELPQSFGMQCGGTQQSVQLCDALHVPVRAVKQAAPEQIVRSEASALFPYGRPDLLRLPGNVVDGEREGGNGSLHRRFFQVAQDRLAVGDGRFVGNRPVKIRSEPESLLSVQDRIENPVEIQIAEIFGFFRFPL